MNRLVHSTPTVFLSVLLGLSAVVQAPDVAGQQYPNLPPATPLATNQFLVTPLTVNAGGDAANVDANLVNPWGLARSSTSPWWVSDNGTGLSTLYGGTGAPVALVVTIP